MRRRPFRSRPIHRSLRICAATSPFRGVISGPLGAMEIGVLDNTGGRMIVYSGRLRMRPPDTIGRFLRAWADRPRIGHPAV
jgi:hypothetical protein